MKNHKETKQTTFTDCEDTDYIKQAESLDTRVTLLRVLAWCFVLLGVIFFILSLPVYAGLTLIFGFLLTQEALSVVWDIRAAEWGLFADRRSEAYDRHWEQNKRLQEDLTDQVAITKDLYEEKQDLMRQIVDKNAVIEELHLIAKSCELSLFTDVFSKEPKAQGEVLNSKPTPRKSNILHAGFDSRITARLPR